MKDSAEIRCDGSQTSREERDDDGLPARLMNGVHAQA
jgi:hypothetical protein